jgi:hypothetical protein
VFVEILVVCVCVCVVLLFIILAIFALLLNARAVLYAVYTVLCARVLFRKILHRSNPQWRELYDDKLLSMDNTTLFNLNLLTVIKDICSHNL